MKKRVLFATWIVTVFTASVTACGLPVMQGNAPASKIHAKELTAEVGIGMNLDYAIPLSLEPVQQFAYDLLAHNLEETNPVLSPVSAYVMLCMAANGASGETKEEFQRVLGEDLLCVPDYMMNNLSQKQGDMQLAVANSAWMDETFTAKDDWLGTVKSLFDASVYQTNLDTEETKDGINQWVSDNTNQMIPELLEEPFDESAKLALLNALYFHADWEDMFEAQDTRQQEFRLDDGSAKKVSMMHKFYHSCGYLKDGVSEGVVLPYAGDSYAFVAVKPTGGQSIREWYASYSAEKLKQLIAGREWRDVDLGLVKFTARYRKILNDSLQQMGISKAFDSGEADFSLIGASKDGFNLYLDKVLQEAVIEVSEEGTKAAAVTMGEMDSGGAMMEEESVTFDSPFLYMIVDMRTEMPVFVGIMDDPEE